MFKNLLKSIGFALLMVLFPVIAGVIIQVAGVEDETTVYGIQAVLFALASIIGYLIYQRMHKPEAKKNIEKATDTKDLLWFIPIIISELIVFISGVNLSYDILYYLILLVFTIFVGISEELFFRGIILNILKSENSKYAVIVSSLLFSVLHLTNLAGNITIEYAILQLVFAFIFGLVTAQLTILTKSLVPAIIWHFSHDFIAFICGNELNTMTIIITIVQCVILAIYSIVLFKKIN